MADISMYEAYKGQTVSPLPDGEYLQVRLPTTSETNNQDCWDIWKKINMEAQAISAGPFSSQSMVTRDLIDRSLKGIDKIFAMISDRIKTPINRVFSNTYGKPSSYKFVPYPIRWTGSNEDALSIVMDFCTAAYQVPHVQSNRLDKVVMSYDASILASPLFDLKSRIAGKYFQKEIQGDVDADELNALFAGGNLKPPLSRGLTGERDLPDTNARDDASLKDESAKAPDEDKLSQALAGVDIWKWVPTKGDWAIFAQKILLLNTDGVTAPPVQPYPFTTQSVGSNSRST